MTPAAVTTIVAILELTPVASLHLFFSQSEHLVLLLCIDWQNPLGLHPRYVTCPVLFVPIESS